MKLYDYYRSTASYRVRIALNLKGLTYEKISVHLTLNGGEQFSPDYLQINPQALVPTLDIDGHHLTQSLAIIEYLDEIYPSSPILPQDPIEKAVNRSIALTISCDIHPLNNLRVLNRLKTQFKAEQPEVISWYHHWLKKGFDAIEEKLIRLDRQVPVCMGSDITLADICLIPQIYNAKRFDFELDDYPLIQKINDYCLSLPPFINAKPE